MTRDLNRLQTLRDCLHKLADSIANGAPLAEDLARESMLALEGVAHLVVGRAPRMRGDPYDTSRDDEDDAAWRASLADVPLGNPGDDEERGDAARERRLAYEHRIAAMRAADAARCSTCDHASVLHVGGDGVCMYDDANDHTPCPCVGFTVGKRGAPDWGALALENQQAAEKRAQDDHADVSPDGDHHGDNDPPA